MTATAVTSSTATDVRVSFRQPVSSADFVDAAWWPHTHDLVAELPGLLDVLWTAGREVVRVSYSMEFWDAAPKKLSVQGRVVKLGGHHVQNPLLISLIDLWGRDSLDVLVISPETPADVAARALELASRAGDPDRPEELMAAAAR